MTIKDLKAFYRKMFSNDDKLSVEYDKYDPQTFLSEEDPRGYEYES